MEKQGKERERERIEEMGKRKEAFSNERWKTHFYLNGIRYRAKIIPFDDQRGIEQESRIKRGVDNAKKKKKRGKIETRKKNISTRIRLVSFLKRGTSALGHLLIIQKP